MLRNDCAPLPDDDPEVRRLEFEHLVLVEVELATDGLLRLDDGTSETVPDGHVCRQAVHWKHKATALTECEH